MIKDQVDVYSGSRIRFGERAQRKKTFRIFARYQKFGKSFSLAPPCRWRSYSSTGNVASARSATRHVYNPVTSPAIKYVSRHANRHVIRHATRHVSRHVSKHATRHAIRHATRHAIRHVSSPVIN